MGSTLRGFLIGFALVAGGIMAANGLWLAVTPNVALAYPGWVVLCLVPAYWYGAPPGRRLLYPCGRLQHRGCRAGGRGGDQTLEYPQSAVGPGAGAALVCLFFLARRRFLPKGRGRGTHA